MYNNKKYFLVLLCTLLCLSIGCDDEADTPRMNGGEETAGESNGVNQAGEAMAGEAVAGEAVAGEAVAGEAVAGEAVAGEMTESFDANVYTGSWDMKIRLVDVGNIEVDFRMEIQASDSQLDLVSLTVMKEGEISDVVATANDVAVQGDGSFSLSISEAVIPGPYSPTGSDVVVTFVLEARPTTEGSSQFCGDVTGEVVTLSLPITMSTFGTIMTGSSTSIPGSCDDEQGPMMLPRLMECPDLSAGLNMLSSGGYERGFEVILPSAYTVEQDWPVVLLWHGFGSSPEELKLDTDLATFAESEGFILVVPSSYPDGAVEWDSLSAADSPDLAFFDDLLKCLSESFAVDEQRIHSTGLSAGGLWTAYLSVFRSEVLASSVGMSSGLIPDYPAGTTAIPYLAAWGGEEDIAYDQNFDTLARDLISDFVSNGHYVLSCNHNLEHVWLSEFSPWVVRFLLDHPKGLNELPYAAGLPEGVYPDYCTVVNAE